MYNIVEACQMLYNQKLSIASIEMMLLNIALPNIKQRACFYNFAVAVVLTVLVLYIDVVCVSVCVCARIV